VKAQNASQDNIPNGLPQITGNVTINGRGARIARSGTAPDARRFDMGGGFLTLNEVTLENGGTGPNIYSNRLFGAIPGSMASFLPLLALVQVG